MAASKGYIGKGTVVSVGVGSGPETWTPIAQLKTAQFGGQKMNFEDVTNLDSAAVGATVLKEQMPTTADAGTIALGGIFLPSDAGQLALATAYNGALTDFKVQLPKGPGQSTTGNLYAFSGYVSEQVIPDIQFDKVLTFKATVTLTTPITITPGT
jgi:hypothetical protein